jgi:hypothetical protein
VRACVSFTMNRIIIRLAYPSRGGGGRGEDVKIPTGFTAAATSYYYIVMYILYIIINPFGAEKNAAAMRNNTLIFMVPDRVSMCTEDRFRPSV